MKDKNETWFHAANDVAMYIPMMEMSGKRVNYIPETTYLYNPSTGFNNHKLRLREQKANDKYIRTLPRYSAIS